LSSPPCPDRLWGPSFPMDRRGSVPGG